MRAPHLRQGPGPVRASPPQESTAPVGLVLLTFYDAHATAAIIAADAASEAQVRRRIDVWALGRVGELIQRVAAELPAPPASEPRGSRREAGQ